MAKDCFECKLARTNICIVYMQYIAPNEDKPDIQIPTFADDKMITFIRKHPSELFAEKCMHFINSSE